MLTQSLFESQHWLADEKAVFSSELELISPVTTIESSEPGVNADCIHSGQKPDVSEWKRIFCPVWKGYFSYSLNHVFEMHSENLAPFDLMWTGSCQYQRNSDGTHKTEVNTEP